MSRYAFLRHRDIESIPARGAIIVTITMNTAKGMREGIALIRGAALTKRCRFVSINQRGHEKKLEGMVGPVIFAHCFRLFAPPHLMAEAARIACGVMLADKARRARPTKH